MSTLAIIPCRAGSERLPGKNRLEIGGVPLWRRALDVALAARIDEIIVSTDDEAILDAGDSHAVERPAHLCTATAPIESVIAHHMRDEHNLIVLLNPTSPFRSVATVTTAIEYAQAWRAGTAVSVVERRDPHLEVAVSDAGLLVGVPGAGWPRSQDVEPAYRIHGAVIVTRPEHIRRGSLLGHPCAAVITSQLEAVDIDTDTDVRYAEALSVCMMDVFDG